MSGYAKIGANGTLVPIKKIGERSTCFATLDPIAFAEFFLRERVFLINLPLSMFLLTRVIVVDAFFGCRNKVPPPFSTSIQDGYLEVGEIMQATWMLGVSHGVSPIPIPRSQVTADV